MPLWLGSPKSEVIEKLYAYYGVSEYEALLRIIGDDYRWSGHVRWKIPGVDKPGWLTC